MSVYDVAIIGGGCVGAAIFSELALAGLTRVAIIDHGRGSTSATAASGGMYRVFHEHPEHVALALCHRSRVTAYEQRGWLQPSGSANGSLYFCNRARYATYATSLQRMQAARYPFEVVDAAQGRACFPQFHWGDDDIAIYEPTAGQSSPTAFADDMIAMGLHHGLTLHDDVEVTSVTRRHGVHRLTTSKGTISARLLVLAGGARMLPLLASIAPQVTLSARRLSLLIGAKTSDEAPNYFDRETLEFAGFGLARHVTTSTRRPARLRRPLWSEVIGEAHSDDCYSGDRLGTPDVPGQPRLIIAAGWGGTAFKLALGIAGHISQRIVREINAERETHVSA